MNREELLKKLTAMLDEARRTCQWGNIQIVLQAGEPVTLHENRTTNLRKEGNTHESRPKDRY
jgi:hypothetical protein